jgi:hypothetical protein
MHASPPLETHHEEVPYRADDRRRTPTARCAIARMDRRHPADNGEPLAYAVLRMGEGVEVAWNGHSFRSLPHERRQRRLIVVSMADNQRLAPQLIEVGVPFKIDSHARLEIILRFNGQFVTPVCRSLFAITVVSHWRGGHGA